MQILESPISAMDRFLQNNKNKCYNKLKYKFFIIYCFFYFIFSISNEYVSKKNIVEQKKSSLGTVNKKVVRILWG